MKSLRCAAIILEVGLSSRTSSLKPLLSLGGQTILERVLATYLQHKIDIHLVVGYQQAEIRKRLINQKTTIVGNPDYKAGMLFSVQAGIRSISDRYDAFFITPVDIPLIRPYTIKVLLDASINHPDRNKSLASA